MNVVSSDIRSPQRKRTCESFSLGVTQITCNSEHQCFQVITEWEEPFHGWPPVWRANDLWALASSDAEQ